MVQEYGWERPYKTSAVFVTDVTFDEPMEHPQGANISSALASPPSSWDPKPGREAPTLNCGFSKASERHRRRFFLRPHFFSDLSFFFQNQRPRPKAFPRLRFDVGAAGDYLEITVGLVAYFGSGQIRGKPLRVVRQRLGAMRQLPADCPIFFG